MIVFHGSYTEVSKPDLLHSRDNIDFGKGFYVTPLKEQAERWAKRFVVRKGQGIISSYSFDEQCLKTEFMVLRFDAYSEEWLDYIIECRSGKLGDKYDIIIGGVANDKVFNTIELFFDSLIDKAEAIKRLRYEKPNQQVCFRTEKALNLLAFKGSERI